MDSSLSYMGRKSFSNNLGHHCFWNSAPDELIARIIALLPCSNIYLARGVCRRWRSIIWSPLFMALCKQWSHPRKPWLLEFQQQMYNQAWAFDLDGRQWFHLNFFFLPENAIIMASSGGLVCLGRLSLEGYTLYVCNPVTKNWRQLPPIPSHPGVVLLDVDRQSSTYKVVALVLRGQSCNTRPSGSVFVLDSKIGVWRETIGVPQELHCRNLWDASLCGRFLCCLTTCQRTETFDVVKAEWTLNAPFTRLPNDAGTPSYLFNQAGNWGVVLPHRGRKGKSVLRYDMSERCWRPVCPANSVVCVGRFSSFCSSTLYDGLEVYVLHPDGHKFYTSTSSSSSLLPKSPLTRHKIRGREIFIRGVWFEPHLQVTT